MATEKRFYYARGVVWDTNKPNGLNGISINDLDKGLRVANWLTDLNDENEQLKSYTGEMEDYLARLEEKNEQLKSTINTLTHDNTKMKKVLNTTKKENEHIKQVIKEAYNNERSEMGRMILRQLSEDVK